MHKEKARSKGWWVIANALTTVRLAIAIYIIFGSPTVETFFVYVVVGGMTDLFDGMAARRGGQSYEGAFYDKGVDKLFCAAALGRFAYLCVILYDWQNFVIALIISVAAVIVLEILIAVAGIIFAILYGTRAEASYWGKSKMSAEIVTAGLAILFLARNNLIEFVWLILAGLSFSFFLGIMSLAGYVRDYRKIIERRINIK